jgi:predicted transcriptional regulator
VSIWLEIVLAIGASFAAALVSLLIYHSNTKRKEGALEQAATEHKRQTEAQWRRIQAQEHELSGAKTELAVLKALISGMPSEATIRGYLEGLESKLEARLNNLATSISGQIESLLERDRTNCRHEGCPMQGNDGRHR